MFLLLLLVIATMSVASTSQVQHHRRGLRLPGRRWHPEDPAQPIRSSAVARSRQGLDGAQRQFGGEKSCLNDA